MLDHIEFKTKEFGETRNVFGGELTKNTIVLCNSLESMNMLHEAIKTCLNKPDTHKEKPEDGIMYHCEDEDINNAIDVLCFSLQRVIKINEQYITLSLEPSIVYKADCIEDIWFLDKMDTKYEIYDILCFKGSTDKWNEGKDAVYKYIVEGRYGCYYGNWVSLCKEKEKE